MLLHGVSSLVKHYEMALCLKGAEYVNMPGLDVQKGNKYQAPSSKKFSVNVVG